MKVDAALQGVTRLFLDTAPVIYYIEKHPNHVAASTAIFNLIDQGVITAVLSPVTLAECLVVPQRLGLVTLQQDFISLITYGRNTDFVHIDDSCAVVASELRVRYNLSLLDALQVAAALNSGCEALLTNDVLLRRVSEIRILLMDDLEG